MAAPKSASNLAESRQIASVLLAKTNAANLVAGAQNVLQQRYRTAKQASCSPLDYPIVTPNHDVQERMDPAKYHVVAKLFEEVRALPPGSRSQWLAERCQEADVVDRVLQMAEKDDELEPPGTSQTHASLNDDTLREDWELQSTPTSIDDYECLEEIGRGGLGVIFRARQISLNRVVAIKMLQRKFHASHENVVRFQFEAEAVARLDHPSIVPIYEIGDFNGQPFFSMKLIDGNNLSDWLQTEPRPLRDKVSLMVSVARAIHYAHLSGVLHRDIKPANILVDSDDVPHVTDFGLAKQIEDESDLTQTGQIMGTPSYMSPEQARADNKRLTVATDIYGLGAILYECLTGEPPFQSDSVFRTIRDVVEAEPVRPRKLNQNVGSNLETICLKCLQKEPSRRYATAEAVADDLTRWMNHEPIMARPVSLPEKAWLFCRRRPLAAALSASLGILLMVAIIGGVEGGNRLHARGMVSTLLAAETREVPNLIAPLENYRRLTDPLLRAALDQAQADGNERRQLHASLALLPSDNEQTEYLHRQILLADPTTSVVIRDVLGRPDAAFSSMLWSLLIDHGQPAAKRFRAAIALAAYDPPTDHNANRWRQVAGFVADQTVETLIKDPASLATLTNALTPIKGELTPRLSDLFRDIRSDRSQHRFFATSLLVTFLSEDDDRLCDLIVDADEQQFVSIFAALEKRRDSVVGRLQEELTREPQRDWREPPKDQAWHPLNPEVRQALEDASGIVHERFAVCQSLPENTLEEMLEDLAESGYTPVRIRPHLQGDQRCIAAIWQRDGKKFVCLPNATEQQIREKDRELRRLGMSAVDLAIYPDVGDSHQHRHLGVWKRQSATPRESMLQMTTGVDFAKAAFAQATATKFRPQTIHRVQRSDGLIVTSQIFEGPDDSAFRQLGLRAESSLADANGDGKIPVDVSFIVQQRMADEEQILERYDTIWHTLPRYEAASILRLPIEDHRSKIQELITEDFRPVGICVGPANDGAVVGTSVFHRPVISEIERGRTAKRKAVAAVALLRLGKPDGIWELFRHTSHPTTRSYLIHLVRPLGIDVRTIYERLVVEQDQSARRALIHCLGEYPYSSLPTSLDLTLTDHMTELYRADPDPGVRAAAQWVLHQWDLFWKCDDINQQLAGVKVHGDRDWYVNSQFATMVILRGPRDFQMGSPPEEPDRMEGETLHTKRISRDFAISATEVTVRQWLEFLQENPSYANEYTRRHSPNDYGPRISLSWYEAAAYCNWLSEHEGIPRDQWCYEPNAKGRYESGMKVRSDVLQRTGYRLPTEAEWECTCRAGSLSHRYFGESDELLRNYAWYRDVSQNRSWPVASLKPNDFGLFDMHGNVAEWCLDRWLGYSPQPNGVSEDLIVPEQEVINAHRYVNRGGKYRNVAADVRSADRYGHNPNVHLHEMCFRPARTMPSQ